MEASKFRKGELIEYTSFAPGGYSPGQVIRYADAAEQDNPADPRLYIRSQSGSAPPVRESQLRRKPS